MALASRRFVLGCPVAPSILRSREKQQLVFVDLFSGARREMRTGPGGGADAAAARIQKTKWRFQEVSDGCPANKRFFPKIDWVADFDRSWETGSYPAAHLGGLVAF